MMKALILLSYYACLRAGEVLNNTADHIIAIDNEHIEMGQDKLHLKIKLPTYKHSNGPAVLIIPSCTQTTYCPVNSVLNYLLVRNDTTGPLFLNQDDSLLKRRPLADLIKSLVKLLNLQPRSYNTHSLRRGRTADLASKTSNTSNWTCHPASLVIFNKNDEISSVAALADRSILVSQFYLYSLSLPCK